ncbi:uncharacterized protein [Ambystoma mexicanum]|uniref:uncharacterized protein isoform X5 n=1 Tax=Ambystoma mexicanum TaxID=8296 RepID=UPI0037E8E801
MTDDPLYSSGEEDLSLCFKTFLNSKFIKQDEATCSNIPLTDHGNIRGKGELAYKLPTLPSIKFIKQDEATCSNIPLTDHGNIRGKGELACKLPTLPSIKLSQKPQNKGNIIPMTEDPLYLIDEEDINFSFRTFWNSKISGLEKNTIFRIESRNGSTSKPLFSARAKEWRCAKAKVQPEKFKRHHLLQAHSENVMRRKKHCYRKHEFFY